MVMANCNVTVTVPSSSSGTWSYAVNGGVAQTGCINLAEVAQDDTLTFVLTLQPETSGATVAFDTTTPLQFVNWKNQNLNNPMWYDPELSSNNTVLTFTDDSLNVYKRTYYFKINATYNGASRTSPDPTIINAGTGGTSPLYTEEHQAVKESEAAV
jgi:hypothetical protein